MSEDDDDFQIADWDSRAREIIKGLSRDGYPELDQLAIVTGTLGMLLAKCFDDADHLMGCVADTKELIELGAKTWFDLKSSGYRL
jgi:hypothetical protein